METPKILRDCLKTILETGSQKSEAHIHAYLLAKEFKRLDWSLEIAIGAIDKWSEHCDPPLMGSGLSSIYKTVNKVYEKDDPPLSCAEDRFLKENGYCFLKSENDSSCEFNNAVQLIKEFLRNRKIQEVGWNDWERYFQHKYKSIWLYLVAFYSTLKRVEIERGIPQNGTIFIGFRAIRNSILLRYRDYRPSLETLCMCSKVLEDEGLITAQRVPHSKRGAYRKQANGYMRVVPLPPVPQYTHTMRDTQIMCSSRSIHSMCTSEEKERSIAKST